jgi:succinyl-diaminopimelate desuccinylase
MPLQTITRNVDRWIDAHRKDIVDLTCRLVSIDTTVPPGRNYPKIAQTLAQELKELGAKTAIGYISESTLKRKVSPEVGLSGPRPNTYGTIEGDGEGPSILLNGHVDVVPAQTEGWTSDPFKPVVKNGRIYGRGAADMKGSDAAMIYSLRALVETGAHFHGSITPTFTTDEEVGGYTGVNYLIDQKVISKNIDYCLSPDSNIDVVDIASLGDVEILVRVEGKPAHSGRGWMGVNAIEYGASLVERLKLLGAVIAKRRSKIPTDPMFGNTRMRPGLYITMVKGGTKGNIIPDTCEILVDRRFIPEEKRVDVLREVEAVVRDFSRETGVKVETKPILGYEPMLTPPNHRLVKVVRKAARKVLKHDVPPRGSQGSTDVAAVSHLGIPVAILGTVRSDSRIHGIDEQVRINDVVSVAKIFAHCYLELLQA